MIKTKFLLLRSNLKTRLDEACPVYLFFN